MSKNSCIRVFADVNQINNCKKIISKNENKFKTLSNALGLAGNEVRLKIIFLLQQENKMCPCDISDVLEMTVPAISQHLKKLREGGIIEDNKVAQTVFYSLSKNYENIISPLLNLMQLPIKEVKNV